MAITLVWATDHQPLYAGFLGGNSQNVGLSSALPALSNAKHIGGGDIIVDNDALLPESGVLGTSADLSDTPENTQISVYVVRQGDSLASISKMFGVSVNTIVWANDLNRSTPLREGQTLTILPINGIRHTVTKGETLASIAKKFKGDIKEIAQFNDLSADSALAVGQVVLVPDGEVAPAVSTSGKVVKNPVRGASGPDYSGYFIRPVGGGYRTQGLHGYNGVDLASRPGTEILAAAPGKVIVSKVGGWNGGYGSYVVINHPNGTQTLYAHLQNSIVAVGQEVERGQVIGYMGATGKATGVHLHFEIHGAKNPF